MIKSKRSNSSFHICLSWYFPCRTKTLPSIEEAWSLPIPAELTSRHGNSPNPNNNAANKPGNPSMGVQRPQDHAMYGLEGPDAKKRRKEEPGTGLELGSSGGNPQPSSTTQSPTAFLTPHQMQNLQLLQQNQVGCYISHLETLNM